MISTVSKKGQITIPQKIRDHLKLQPGDKIEFEIRRDGSVQMIGKKIDVSELRGMLGPVSRRLTIRQMDDGIRKHAVERDRASRSRPKG